MSITPPTPEAAVNRATLDWQMRGYEDALEAQAARHRRELEAAASGAYDHQAHIQALERDTNAQVAAMMRAYQERREREARQERESPRSDDRMLAAVGRLVEEFGYILHRRHFQRSRPGEAELHLELRECPPPRRHRIPTDPPLRERQPLPQPVPVARQTRAITVE